MFLGTGTTLGSTSVDAYAPAATAFEERVHLPPRLPQRRPPGLGAPRPP
ncbi:hypothetical protein ABZ490_23735 [Streptomyces sp. NPDC005811]